ncbi:unnamed protein product [Sphenostylis stenocarpa]|uniref:CRM domain-containing protein n=1 Tax=Sphenostylis stenocarpa TaxID=92480 RepID=A0AA86RW97_9FABA|nr:unnamed protein product [Sphenostylis stenocarpa]
MLDDIHNHLEEGLKPVRIKCLGVPTLDMDHVCFHLEVHTRGGVTHNMLDDIHNHWKKAEAVRIKCLGVPTLDMDHVCFHLEDKSYGKPKLVKNVNEGLTYEETKEMRNIVLNSDPLMKLTRNGVYVNVVERLREAFKTQEVVRLDCTHVGTSDCKKIGVKLRDLVPCVPILFKDEHIILWRGKLNEHPSDSHVSKGKCTDSRLKSPNQLQHLCKPDGKKISSLGKQNRVVGEIHCTEIITLTECGEE